MSHDLSPSQFARLAALFEQVSGLESSARDSELARLAETEPAVHQQLIAMLHDGTAAGEAEAELEALASRRLPETVDLEVSELEGAFTEGTVIDDRYRLSALLGAGGMGEVWSAEQLRPVARQVAIKILRQGVTSGASSARMRVERQALATMDHPNIASIFDGGEHADGKPYFVMELVPKGLPITVYCEHHQLDLEDRLRLMLQVSSAVEHAHQKRIIHRDLKPSNVMVCEPADDRFQQPVVKVIDFGIAKPLPADGDLVAGGTRFGELVGTPEYMSPEQAALGTVDVDTRSDVYSLGLILFELLVGELPLSGEQLRRLPIDAQCRHIREAETPRPSTRIRRSSSSVRQLGEGAWRKVRGDLDRIVLAALAKDREQRYRSVAAFADDLERFLRHQPVQVAPPTIGYRLAKFARRHRIAVAFAALALLGAAVALAGVSIGLVRAQRAEAVARIEAATTRQISDFLEGLLREGNPEEAAGAGSIRGLLDRGAERVRTELIDEPVVRARLMLTIADAYRALGQYDPAIELAEQSLDIYRSMSKPNTNDFAAALGTMTHILMNAGRHDRALEMALEHHQIKIRALGPSHPDLAASLFQIGTAHWRLGDFEQARESLEAAVEHRSSPAEPVHESLPRLQNNLAILYWQLDRMEDAERLYREALGSLESIRGPDHPHVASTLNNLALVYENQGDIERALDVHRQALAIRERIFEPPHPDLGESMNNIGTALTKLERLEEAREILEPALAMRRAVYGEEANDLVASTVFNLANALPAEEQQQARALFEESLVGLEASLGNQHPTVAYPLIELGILEMQAGRHEAALPLLSRAYALRQDALPAEHQLLLPAKQALCEALHALGRSAEAEISAAECEGLE